MKKILIITLYGNNNFGNKLQNYALQESLKKIDSKLSIKTIKVKYDMKTKNFSFVLLKLISWAKKLRQEIFSKRFKAFKNFNKDFIIYENGFVDINSKKPIKGYNYFIYGSDQIWNPNGVGKTDLFIGLLTDNNISYAASLSADSIPEELKEKYAKSLMNFKKISVREENGKKLLSEIINRKDIEVLIDPTLLITKEEWEKVAKKPKQLKNINNKKYILNYFLGELSTSKRKEIDRVAKENNCVVINLLDKSDPFYDIGPREFLYLEKNAFLVCTDSFHSSVFSMIFDRPFVVFEREDKINSMFSRLDTLIIKFKLKNRKYNNIRITSDNINHDYKEAYNILKKEQEKAISFLKDSIK